MMEVSHTMVSAHTSILFRDTHSLLRGNTPPLVPVLHSPGCPHLTSAAATINSASLLCQKGRVAAAKGTEKGRRSPPQPANSKELLSGAEKEIHCHVTHL